MTRVGLFVPCYVDQLYPDVGLATLEVLERFGCEVDFPEAQTCCGQPMANTGCDDAARPLALRYLEIFRDYDYIVCPSGSCTAMVRNHYAHLVHGHWQPDEFERVRSRTYELCEFLVDVLKVSTVTGHFPYQVGLHQSCHGLRELRLGKSSEMMVAGFSKAGQLLAGLEGIRFSELSRVDECCGFGGTFAVQEEAVSCMMGLDRLHDHQRAGTQVLTAGDMSCLMHLAGLLQRKAGRLAVAQAEPVAVGAPSGSAAVTGTVAINPMTGQVRANVSVPAKSSTGTGNSAPGTPALRPMAVMHVAQILAGRQPDVC